jgi:hypothetical protein
MEPIASLEVAAIGLDSENLAMVSSLNNLPTARRSNRIAFVALIGLCLSSLFGGSNVWAGERTVSGCDCACGVNCGANCCCAKSKPVANERGRANDRDVSNLRVRRGNETHDQGGSGSSLSVRSCPRNCPGEPTACGGLTSQPAAIVNWTPTFLASLVSDCAELESLIPHKPFPSGLLRPPRD